ncbi:LacI family DNA-binding transcriptional regulator [Nonomuraea sp. NPDC050404]|uniref:LacI family DNA-binding transcriptional regulator n=1 Tax=Nonomuraea sp. NPDC050404 TaxID=3155783 RepID=UPI003400C57B
MPTPKTKLTDLAEYVGISTATVSRVLNGRGGVSEDTRKQVMAALDALGYERPAKLRSTSAGLVGLIVPSLDNPIYPSFAQMISSDLARRGLTPIMCPQDIGGVSEDEYVAALLEHQVVGIIFVAGHHADQGSDKLRYQRLVSAGLPIVLINGYSPDIDAHFVSDDDAAGVEIAIDHLATLGHERIGLTVGPHGLVSTERRIQAFAARIEERFGVDAAESVASSLLSVEGGQVAAGQLMDTGHTALICGSDYMALGAVRAAHARGLKVPGDVSIVGHDDSFLIGFTNPALTTLRQSVFPMCQAAVSILATEIASGRRSPGSELVFRPELLVRESTGLAPRLTS